MRITADRLNTIIHALLTRSHLANVFGVFRHQPRKRQPRRKGQPKLKDVVRCAAKLRRAGNFDEALALCDGLDQPFRDHPKILRERGYTLVDMGNLDDAYDAFRRVLASDPTQTGIWTRTGMLLQHLGRADELPAFIESMLRTLPPTSENVLAASSIAANGRLHDLADKLLDDAVSPSAPPNPATLLRAARILLDRGDEGRAVHILDKRACWSDHSLNGEALDLRGLAMARLRAAGRSNASTPVSETERADVIAVGSILDHSQDTRSAKAAGRGLAIVSNSLGPGGSETQAVRLVRELCNGANELVGPIFLLLISRSTLAASFHSSKLAGLDVTVECIADFDVDVASVVPPGVAAKLSVLPRNQCFRTAFLVDRLRVHNPAAVLALSERAGIAAMLAASIIGVPRIVISARGEPPPVRGTQDSFAKAAYQAALSRNKITLVTNSSATASGFAKWLELPPHSVAAIHNGIDMDELLVARDAAGAAAHRRSLGIRDGTRVVGSVFNARKEKRPRLWIEAAAQIAKRAPDVAFVVVGGGHARDGASAILAQHGLERRFYTPGVREDVATWLELMDVVLLTSKTEGLPNVLLEAQAMGRPVIATAVGGSAETFVPDQTGILLPANPSPDQVADAVMRVLDDPEFMHRTRTQGPAFIRQRFGVERMAAEFVDLCFDTEP